MPPAHRQPTTDWNALPLDQLFARLIDGRWLGVLLDQAMAEDLDQRGDITSQLTVSAEAKLTAHLRSRGEGRLAGLPLVSLIAKRYDPQLRVWREADDGQPLKPGQTLARLTGPARSLLGAERVILNMLSYLCGIATWTGRFVEAVAGTGATIMDTRKTLPGYRRLAKYAVRCGGGQCHRLGLYDALLIKDNHLAGATNEQLTERISRAVADARQLNPAPSFLEVEVDTLDQLQQVLTCPVDRVLLDNMGPADLRQAVAMRDAKAPSVKLEASGGINLQTVRQVAEAGVDYISVGALTHSPPALDLGLDID